MSREAFFGPSVHQRSPDIGRRCTHHRLILNQLIEPGEPVSEGPGIGHRTLRNAPLVEPTMRLMLRSCSRHLQAVDKAMTIDADQPGALDRIRASLPDLLVIDLRLGQAGSGCWDLARELRSESDFSGLPILVCSADLAALNEIEPAVADGPRAETLAKPFGIDELTGAIDRLLAEPIGR